MSAGYWTDAEREAVCEWLRLHDVDPGRVPENASFEHDLESNRWTTALIHVGAPDVVGMEEVSFVERVPWPLPLTSSTERTTPPSGGRVSRSRA